MSKVQTTKGLIDINKLEVVDVISTVDNARVIATEWRLNEELVRRDVNVNVLRGISATGEQTSI